MKHRIFLRPLTTVLYRIICCLIFTLFSLHLRAQSVKHDSTLTNLTLEARLKALRAQMIYQPAPADSNKRRIGFGFPSLPRNNEPLYIVDGGSYPVALASALPENKIARIDLLKGGQSATLFGSEGVNGAILITTNFKKRERKRFLRRNKSLFESSEGYAYLKSLL